MAFKDRFPKPTLQFLGIDCEIVDWKVVYIDMIGEMVHFTARCSLTSGGNPVFLHSCRFAESINWPLNEYLTLNAENFSLNRENNEYMEVTFSIPLPQLEPILALPG